MAIKKIVTPYGTLNIVEGSQLERCPEKPEPIDRPFEITVTQEFLDILKGAGGWMIEIPYKIGEHVTIYVRENKEDEAEKDSQT